MTLLSNPSVDAKELWVDNNPALSWVSNDDWSYQQNNEQFPWKTIQHACDEAQPGDIINVRANTSRYEPFKIDGKSDLLIRGVDHNGQVPQTMPREYLIARATADDANNGQMPLRPIIDSSSFVPVQFTDLQGNTVAANTVPIDRELYYNASFGRYPQDIGQYSRGIVLSNCHNIVIENLLVTDFWIGVVATNCTFVEITNVFVFDVGRRYHSSFPSDPEQDPLAGNGILVNGSAGFVNYVIDSVVLNSANEGVTLNANSYCFVDECAVFADDDSTGWASSTDYYFLCYKGGRNEFSNCKAERYPDTQTDLPISHPGHGFSLSAELSLGQVTSGNYFHDCQAYDIRDVILMRGLGVTANTFESIDSEVSLDVGHNKGMVALQNGPSQNTFRKLFFKNSDVAIAFIGNKVRDNIAEQNRLVDDGIIAPGDLSCGNDNIFENCVFECELAIDCNDDTDENTATSDLANGASFRAARTADGNVFNRCIVAGFHKYFVGKENPAGGKPLQGSFKGNLADHPNSIYQSPTSVTQINAQAAPFATSVTATLPFPKPPQTQWVIDGFDFHQCCFFNRISGSEVFPSWYASNNNNLFADPLFVGSYYRLSNASPCVDAFYGLLAIEDVFEQTRSFKSDIGAHEYSGQNNDPAAQN